ncbi:MAG: hypothetical protein ACOZNI_16760, partial [Myxococcota bacterium]
MTFREKSILPGFRLTLTWTVIYLSVIVLIPLGAMFAKSFSLGWNDFAEHAFSERTLLSLRLSFTTALIAAMPWLFLEARGGGVAVVEAALVAGALALLVADRGMARAWTAPAVAGLGALALMLRDEAHWFVWPLGILLFSRGRRWGRVLLVLVAWGVAGAPAVFRIADAALLSWRGGLESRVDPGSVSTILRLATSGAVGLVGLAGIGLAVVVGARRVRAGDRPDAVVFV